MISAKEAHLSRCKDLTAKKATLDKWLEKTIKTVSGYIDSTLNEGAGHSRTSNMILTMAKDLDDTYQMEQLVSILTKQYGYKIDKCAKANSHGTAWDLVISWAHLDCDDCTDQNDEPKKPNDVETLEHAIEAMHDALTNHSHTEACNV